LDLRGRSRAFEAPEFRTAFASFLRRRSDDWRVRRVDHFTPLDLYTARRRITLQGNIDRELLGEFSREYPSLLSARAVRNLRDGDAISVYLPLAQFSKRVLLGFSIRDELGRAVSLLPRVHSGTVTGLHLLNNLESGLSDELRTELLPKDQGERRAAEFGAIVVAATLSVVNPFALERRLAAWRRNWHRDQDDRTCLLDWVERESNLFRDELGANVRTAVEGAGVLGVGDLLPRYLPSLKRRSPALLADKLSTLILLAVRDTMKVLVFNAPVQRRVAFAESAEDLFAAYAQTVLPGIKYFCQLASYLPADLASDVGNEIVDYTGYVAVPIYLGHHFILKTEQVLDLPPRSVVNRIFTSDMFTYHAYQLPIGDSPATHVEVTTGDPELEICVPRRKSPAPKIRWQRTPAVRVHGSRRLKSTSILFGNEFASSHGVVHYYTSRRRGERPRMRASSASLVVRYRVTPAVRRGYLVLTAAVIIANTWIAWRWIHPALNGRKAPGSEEALLLVSAAFVALPTWLMTVQHKTLLVHQKLRGFRIVFAIGAGAPVASAGVAWLIRHHYPADCWQSVTAAASWLWP
jgi:hypothetical protein